MRIDCRATSLKAMFCADSLGAPAITTAWRSRSGKSMAHCMACMPPRLPPTTAAHWWMPRASARRVWLFTQSFTVIIGKSGPQGWPVSGLVEVGPLEPWQPPRLFGQTTKKRLVSMGLPGPMQFSHQPGRLSSAPW